MRRLIWLMFALCIAACERPPAPASPPAVSPTPRAPEGAPTTAAPRTPQNTPAPTATALSRAPGRLQLIEFYAIT